MVPYSNHTNIILQSKPGITFKLHTYFCFSLWPYDTYIHDNYFSSFGKGTLNITRGAYNFWRKLKVQCIVYTADFNGDQLNTDFRVCFPMHHKL